VEDLSLSWQVRDLSAVAAAARALRRPGKTLVVGIDGPGGAGKSTLARRLGDHLAPATIVAMDDFYRPGADRADRAGAPAPRQIAADFDWQRLLHQVLRPLRYGSARYQRYDWAADRLAEWHDVPGGGTVLVEGVYALKRELREHYDYRLWVTASDAVRLERGVARDGEAARATWLTGWMPAEDAYALSERPVCAADLVVDSPGCLPHDPDRQVVCAAPDPGL
jgi:uridine kinase